MYSSKKFQKIFETFIPSDQEFKKFAGGYDPEFLKGFFKSKNEFQRKWNLHRYKNPRDSNLFHKKVLFNFDLLVELVELQFPELNINRSEIEQYLNNGYFPELYFEDGDRGFMAFTPVRIKFINEIIRKWDYNTEEIRQIIKFEDMIIDDFLTADVFEYSELPSLPLYIKYAKDIIWNSKSEPKSGKGLNQFNKDQLQDYSDVLKMIEGRKWEDLSLDMQTSINDAVFYINKHLENIRKRVHVQYEAKILLGFSPQNSLSCAEVTLPTPTKEEIRKIVKLEKMLIDEFEYSESRSGKKLEDLSVDSLTFFNDAEFFINEHLESILKSIHIQDKPKKILRFSPQNSLSCSEKTMRTPAETEKIHTNMEYPYGIFYYDRTWLFGKWIRNPDLIKPDDVFFATPEFYIGYGKENQINISIRKPEIVGTRFMRDISKYYAKFRKSDTIQKAKWGEKSKERELLDRRNSQLRFDFEWERITNPNKSSEEILKKVLDKARDEFGMIYPETAKRIVYSKKNCSIRVKITNSNIEKLRQILQK